MKLLGKLKKTQTITTSIAVSAMLFAAPAMAQGGFATLLTGTLSQQFLAVADFMSAIAYLGGVGMGIKGALKIKEWNDSKGRDSTLTQAMIPLLIAGMLLALPSVLQVLKQSVSANQAGSTSLTGGGAIRVIQ